MSATIRFLNNLKPFQPEADADGIWRVPPGKTIQEVVDQSGVEGCGEEFMYTVNGGAVLRKYALKDGDELIFMSPFAGG